MNVETSLICTTYQEAESIDRLLDSLRAQTKAPDEAIFVDAGSDDGTIDKLRAFGDDVNYPVSVIVEQGCNIPEGRNIAIRVAAHDIITVVDAGTELDEQYVEMITDPFTEEPDIDVVSGYYLPRVTNAFQKITARFAYIPLEKLDPETFLPSARSVAFRKSAWKDVGECPEHLSFADDTVFALDLKTADKRFELQPEAVVYWDHDSDWEDFLRRRYQYSYWAGLAGVDRGRTVAATRVLVGTVVVTVAAIRRSIFLFLGGMLGVGLVGYLDLMQVNELDTDVDRHPLLEFLLMIVVRVLNDSIVTIGFAVGRAKRALFGPPQE